MQMASDTEIRQAFRAFDANGDGVISEAEFVAVLTRPVPGQPVHFTAPQAKAHFGQVDLDGSGSVEYEEFVKAWASLKHAKPTALRPPGDATNESFVPTAFTSDKYAESWVLAKKHLAYEKLTSINALGHAIRDKLEQCRRIAAEYLYDQRNNGPAAGLHDTSHGILCMENTEAVGYRQTPTLEFLERLKHTEVKEMIQIVNELSEKAFKHAVPGQIGRLSLDINRLNQENVDAVQLVEECFKPAGKFLTDWDVLTPDVLKTFDQAKAILDAGLPEDDGAPYYVKANDEAENKGLPLWDAIKWKVEDKKNATYSRYLFAKHLVHTASFHQEMASLLSPFGTVVHAKMKSYTRMLVKTGSDGDYGEKNVKAEGRKFMEPNTCFLRDILRITLKVESDGNLVKAHTALVAKYKPVVTKDRRNDPPRDVLQTVWFEGLIVEVQFHYAGVVAAKQFSHAAYTIDRVALDSFWKLSGSIYTFSRLGLDKFKSVEEGFNNDIKCLIHL